MSAVRSRRRGARAGVGGLEAAPRLDRWAAAALGVILPDQAQAAFLRACLWRGADGAGALRACFGWLGDRTGPLQLPPWARPLLPLLHRSASEAGVDPGGELARLLRAARAHEEMRAERYAAAVAEVLERLGEAGTEPVVLPGAGIVETAYGDWALRHCHDLDLLVEEGRVARCLAALRDRCRLTRLAGPGRLRGTGLAVHPSGLPVRLHTDLLADPFFARPAAEVRDLSQPGPVAGVPAYRLIPPAALAYVLAQGARRSPLGLWWAADTCGLVRRDFEWGRAVGAIERFGVSVPAATLLAWMAAELRLVCPPNQLAGLATHAEESGVASRDAVLSGTAEAAPGRPWAMVRATGWRDGGRLVAALACPAAGYVRVSEHDPFLPRAYVLRALRYARHVVAARARGVGRPRPTLGESG